MDAHLELVPGVGTFTARGLTAGDAEVLGRETDRAVDLQLLVEGSLLELSASRLKSLHVSGGQSDANAGGLGRTEASFLCLECHSFERGEREKKKKIRDLKGRGRQPWADDNNLILVPRTPQHKQRKNTTRKQTNQAKPQPSWPVLRWSAPSNAPFHQHYLVHFAGT